MVEPSVKLSPKPLPMTTLLYFMSPNQESRAIHVVVGVHVAQTLSCPQLGYALSSLSQRVLCPGSCWALSVLHGRTVGFAAGSRPLQRARLPPCMLISCLTLRGHFAFLFYSQIQRDVLPPTGLRGWKECLYTFLQILNLLIYELL